MTSSLSARPRARHTRTTRRTRLTVAGLLAGIAVAVALPMAASAHVHVTPDEAQAEASAPLVFTFSHGCDDSPTTALTFTIPEGVDGVTPVLDANWTITRELGSNGIPTAVTFTAQSPIESGIQASAAMNVIFAKDQAHTAVPFPVRQTCVKGETDWKDIAATGQSEDDLKAPAPVVAVGDIAANAGHEHGDGDGDGDSDAAAAASQPDLTARWLGGAGLVAGVGLGATALAVALRRRGSNADQK